MSMLLKILGLKKNASEMHNIAIVDFVIEDKFNAILKVLSFG